MASLLGLVPLVDDPRPAAASSHEFEVWSADLSVGVHHTADVGCNNAWAPGMGSQGFQCSNPSVLTADRLVLPDHSGYNIEQIIVPGNPTDGGLYLVLHKTLPLAAREGMTLHVAFGSQTAAYPLSDATWSLGRTIAFPNRSGGNRLFDARSGDTVSLRLTLPAVAPLGPGSLDPTFGIGGTVTSDFGTLASEIHAAAEQPDGKIVVAGFVQTAAGNRDFALARYNTDGTLDTAFGTDGRVVTDVGAGANDEARAVAVQPDGKIVAAGHATVSGGRDFALARYNTDGSLDTGFGKITGNTRTGSATYNFGANDTAYAVAIQSDGKIVAAGQAGNDFGLLRVHDAGDPDGDKAAMGSTPAYTGFGGDGRVTTDMVSADGVSGLADGARALAIDTVGNIVVAGFATSTNGTASDTSDDHKDFAVARYTTAGALDTGFSSGGIAYFDWGSTVDEAHSVTILFDGKIIIGGRSDGFLALIKVTATGASDTDFGSSGGVSFKPRSETDAQLWAVAETSDLQLIVAGQAGDQFYAARLTAAGEFVRDFIGGDTIGKFRQRFFGFAGGVSRARAMVLRNDDSFVVAGYANNGSHNTFALAR
ncbi:MAG: hypothetical protein KTU85_08290, partial [Acidimicrobiia bacterium]|nr:hypothetical protein [Acidimicrobiia bacterium]